MAIEIKHPFVSPKSDGPDTTVVRPSDWNATHEIVMASSRLIGRTTASAGAAEEITVGTGLTLAAGALTIASSVTTDIANLQATDAARRLAMPLADLNNSHNLLLQSGSDLTADRTLTILTNDANTVLDIPALVVGTQTMEFVGTFTAAAAATLDITSGFAVNYDYYIFEIRNWAHTTTNVSSTIRASEDGGTSFIASNVYSYVHGDVFGASPSTSGAASAWTVGNVSNIAPIRGTFKLYRVSATLTRMSFLGNTSNTPLNPVMANGYVNTTSLVNGVRFLTSGASNFEIDMFRIRNQ